MRIMIVLTMMLVCTTGQAEESTITITTGEKKLLQETEKRQSREFCSRKSGEDAKAQCELWMAEQKKSLGKRYLTSFCEFGKATTRTDGCMFASQGELTYVLRLCEEK